MANFTARLARSAIRTTIGGRRERRTLPFGATHAAWCYAGTLEPTHGESPLTRPIVPGEELTLLCPLELSRLDHRGGNLREGQLADFIPEVARLELASDGRVDAPPRAVSTELVR